MNKPFALRLLTLIVLSFLAVFTTHAQSKDVHLHIKDDSTGEPIAFAFVFFENTTIGGNTNEAGQIIFKEESIEDHTIVITHMLYEEVKLKGSDIKDKQAFVRMVPKAFDLEEVIVKTKRGKSKKYKSWMKKFESSFIGNRKMRKKVNILNPEVIWFEEKNDVLYAHAIDNIKLRNELTGYIMHVALSEFSLNDAGDITYSGSIYFNDIKEDLKKVETIEKRRKEYFRQSRQLFFKSLFWKHPVNEEEYVFGITEKKDDNYVFEESSLKKLNWQRGLYADTLDIKNYLTVTIKDKLLESIKKRNTIGIDRDKNSGTSFLFSKSGKFIVNKKGFLLNQSDIEESGYWTSVRMAHELPSDYLGNVYFHQEENISTITELQRYKSTYKPEKIYVHTDKSTYLPFEHLWFKAYLVNAVDHSHDTPSEVVYVDLINEEGKIVNNWLLNSNIGLKGDFQWTPSFTPGTYLLRAYTNHMRNQGEQFFFEKELLLTNLSSSQQDLNSQSKLSRITFHPEGGDLLAGVSSQVAFVALDSMGQAVSISGVVKDNNDTIVTAVQTIHQGIGMFQLIPEASKSYHVEIKNKDEKLRFDLPDTKASGINMRINATNEHNIYIDILSSEIAIHEDAFLIGHMRGEVFAFVNELSVDNPLTIAKSSIPPGIVHFTVFDQYERPQSERLVFNDYNYESKAITAEQINLDNDVHSMTFTIDSVYLENAMDLSISIVDESHYPSAFEEQNISSYFHLNSDLEQHISGLNVYLDNMDKTNRYYLDLILRTQAWRRFTWKDLMSKEELAYSIETGYAISGQVTEKNVDKPVQSNVMITALGPDLSYDQLNTSEDGRFLFENLNTTDTTTYVIQARKGELNLSVDNVKLNQNRLVNIVANAKLGLPFTKSRGRIGGNISINNPFEDEYEQKLSTYAGLQNIDQNIWQIEAPTVTIKSRRGRSSGPRQVGYLNLDYADWIAPEATGLGLVSKVAPSRRYHFGAEGKLYYTTINIYGETVVVPAQVIIDGFGEEPGGSTSTTVQLRTLSADRIKAIYVGKGFISIQTRDIPRSVEERLDSGIIHIDHPGYYDAREFADVSSKIPAKLVSTVLWDPNVNFDDNGNLEISIRQDLQKSAYVVVLEGVSSQGDIISFRKKYE